MTTSHAALQLIDIHYKVGAFSLFQSLNATFQPGIIGLIGANGCGKTTLLKILSGICHPDNGKVMVFGKDLYHSRKKSSIGFVPAQPFLYPHLTVLENLFFAGLLRKMSRSQLQEQILTALTQCDLLSFQKVLFGKLSAGLKKRAALASMLIHQPTLFILDEPCAELDPEQRQAFWDLIMQLRQPSRLILFSSHHPQEMKPFCDQIVLLKQGKLIFREIREYAQ